jgi:hypothetical protein
MTKPITGLDARMLRKADSIVFHADGDHAEIRAVIRATEQTSEITHVIPVEATRVDNFGPGDGPWTCFAMSMNAKYDDVTQTLVRRTRTGSRIAFRWTRDNSSPVTKEAGLVVDMLDVKVQNSSVCDAMRMSTYIGYDNTARMVRPA